MDEDILATFLTEAEERLGEIEQGLVALESNPGDAEVVHRIFRSAHTLKGNAGMVGLDPMVSLAHVAESILARVRARELAIDKDLTSSSSAPPTRSAR